MRLVVLTALLVALLPRPATACIDDGIPRLWRDDLVVLGTVTRVASRRVDAYDRDWEVVRATLEVEEVLWADDDRPPPRTIFVHSADRAGAGAPSPFHGRVGRRWVFVLQRTRVPDVYRCLSARPPEALSWSCAEGRIAAARPLPGGARLALEVLLMNPQTVPVTFAEAGSCLQLVVDGRSTVVEFAEEVSLPAGRYRTLTLVVDAPDLAGREEVELQANGQPLLLWGVGRTSLVLEEPPPPPPPVVVHSGWPFGGERWVERAAWLPPDDPALAPPTVLRPLAGLTLGLSTALLWTVRRRKSLPGGEGGR